MLGFGMALVKGVEDEGENVCCGGRSEGPKLRTDIARQESRIGAVTAELDGALRDMTERWEYRGTAGK